MSLAARFELFGVLGVIWAVCLLSLVPRRSARSPERQRRGAGVARRSEQQRRAGHGGALGQIPARRTDGLAALGCSISACPMAGTSTSPGCRPICRRRAECDVGEGRAAGRAAALLRRDRLVLWRGSCSVRIGCRRATWVRAARLMAVHRAFPAPPVAAAVQHASRIRLGDGRDGDGELLQRPGDAAGAVGGVHGRGRQSAPARFPAA